ncbi:MAG: ATP-binding cassette domain-containing protein [Thermoanaerobaculia bacterium]|nr:ATP-binding cassette domain-containing protein [Thermoanaerobaculia bacterium]
MPDHILEVDAIEKRFGDIRAVDRLSFAVRRGEIFAFLGPNGAGKSTTVRMLVGILRPDNGRIGFHVNGQAEGRLDPSLLGYLPEDRGLYPEVPLIRTLTYMGTIRGMARSEASRAAMKWLERLDLADRAQDKLDALSKGNQQKVQFIASVLHRPAFAVLDEPFSGLDPLRQELFLEILQELRDDGTTVLLSAHQMDLVERVADRALLLSRGREVLSGKIEDIKAEARASSRIFVKLADETAISQLASYPTVAQIEPQPSGELAIELADETPLSRFLATVAGDHEIQAIRSEEPSLHEIFVRLVRNDLNETTDLDEPAQGVDR